MIIEGADHEVVVDTTGRTRGWEMTIGNARLIAAAPVLLTALENLLFAADNGWPNGYDEVATAARAAIEEAVLP
jgi:hypothetical protein